MKLKIRQTSPNEMTVSGDDWYHQFKRDVIACLISWVVIVGGVNLIRYGFDIGLDSTDGTNGDRSGMRLRVDHSTGCQYLETESGAITLRLGRDGKQICGVGSMDESL